MKKYRSLLWLAGFFLLYMVLFPTISHSLELLAGRTFSPLPLFFWGIVSNLLLGAFIVILAVKMWSSSPTPALLVLEVLISGYTVLTLFRVGDNYTMRTLFLGILVTITARSFYIYSKRRKQ